MANAEEYFWKGINFERKHNLKKLGKLKKQNLIEIHVKLLMYGGLLLANLKRLQINTEKIVT